MQMGELNGHSPGNEGMLGSWRNAQVSSTAHFQHFMGMIRLCIGNLDSLACVSTGKQMLRHGHSYIQC